MPEADAKTFIGGYKTNRSGAVPLGVFFNLSNNGEVLRALNELAKPLGYEAWIVRAEHSEVFLSPRSEANDETDTEEANATRDLLENAWFEESGASANEALYQTIAYRIGPRGMAVLSQGTKLGHDAFHFPFERQRVTVCTFYMKPFPANFNGDPFTLMWPEDGSEENCYELQARGVEEAIHAAKIIIG